MRTIESVKESSRTDIQETEMEKIIKKRASFAGADVPSLKSSIKEKI